MKQFYLYPALLLFFFDNALVSSAQQNDNAAKRLLNPESQNSALAVIQNKTAISDDFTDEWYNNAINNIEQMEYNFYPLSRPDNFKAANIKNNISFIIEPSSYSVQNSFQSKQNSWKIKFDLKGIGRNNLSCVPGNNFSITNKSGQLAYRFNDVTIQYINNEEGLRQNFIVGKKPSGAGSLRVAMSVTGTLSATLNNNKLSFFESNDTSVKLVYSDLKVLDANHTSLPSHMQYDKLTHELNLIVDDSKAAYPVLIDPINQSPEWNTSVDGLLSSLLSNLQMKTALYGFVVTSLGDVNGDGFGDVAISAPGLVDIFSGTGSMAAVGAVFVYYGTFSGLPATPSKTLQPNTSVEG
ncbi:MAG: integrin alpha, partial [Bacteroidota bacterium]